MASNANGRGVETTSLSNSQSYCIECGTKNYNYMDTCNECRLKQASRAIGKTKRRRRDFKKR